MGIGGKHLERMRCNECVDTYISRIMCWCDHQTSRNRIKPLTTGLMFQVHNTVIAVYFLSLIVITAADDNIKSDTIFIRKKHKTENVKLLEPHVHIVRNTSKFPWLHHSAFLNPDRSY